MMGPPSRSRIRMRKRSLPLGRSVAAARFVLAVVMVLSTSVSTPGCQASSSTPTIRPLRLGVTDDANTTCQNLTTIEATSARIVRPDDDSETKTEPLLANKTKRKKTKTKSSQPNGASSTTSSGAGGREAACLRRIKREWRDAVKLGIAYDWTRMATISNKNEEQEEDQADKYAYVRMGPWGKNLLRWHFSVQGPPNSDFAGGVYHGRVLLPRDYPGSPPRIQVLTPSGRFVPGADICLSASAFHPESWTPRWNVLSLIEGLRLHMLTTANEIGGMDATPEERRKFARQSRDWILGRSVNHRRMAQAGIFPWVEDKASRNDDDFPSVVTEIVARKRKKAKLKQDNRKPTTLPLDEESDGSVRMTSGRREVQQQLPHPATATSIVLHAVAEVLTSPRLVAVFALLTVFVILNRH